MKLFFYRIQDSIFLNELQKSVAFRLNPAIIVLILILSLTMNLRAEKKKVIPQDSNKVIENVKEYSKKDNIFSKFVKSILVFDDETKSNKIPLDPDRKIIKKYKGKIIRKIEIRIIDVFGASVDNPQDTVRSWLENTGNSLHTNTKDWLIKNMLIFDEGDKFSPFFVQESERIIRQSPYIYDVRIIPQKITNSNDSIDIIVYVQDIWSLNGGGSLSLGNKSGSLYMEDINFLGFGNEFKGGIKIDPQLMQNWDWDGSYLINNISNTFISAKLYYLSELNLQHYGLMLSRDFISPVIDWGGGIAQHWQTTRYPDSIFPAKYASYNQQDYWLGYAFNTIPYDTTSYKHNSFNVAGRVSRTVFSRTPDDDSLKLFQDNTLYLARIGYSDITFYQDQYIFGLGKTEDVPLISTVELLFGYENGENFNSLYLGAKSGYSFLTNNLGYLYSGMQIGSFLNYKARLNLTAILEIMYFSKLNVLGNWKWRHYIGSRFSYNNDPIRQAEVLNINNEGGLRGFSDNYLKGNKKLVINYEADFFVPLKFLGFKLAIITFADLGLISPYNTGLFQSTLFQGYGFGFRVKNEHLIFPTFQFMFGYYPNSPQSAGEQFNIFYQNSMYYKFKQYQFSIPSIVTIE